MGPIWAASIRFKSCRSQSSLFTLFKCDLQEGTGRLSRGAAWTRPNRRKPSRKLPSLRGSSLITRNEAPSSCQYRVAPESIWNRSRRGFGTTVCPLLVTVLVMVRISFIHPVLASQKEKKMQRPAGNCEGAPCFCAILVMHSILSIGVPAPQTILLPASVPQTPILPQKYLSGKQQNEHRHGLPFLMHRALDRVFLPVGQALELGD